MEEFEQALDTSIKPMLQQQFASVLEDVRQGLQTVNREFTQRLDREEEKNSALIN